MEFQKLNLDAYNQVIANAIADKIVLWQKENPGECFHLGLTGGSSVGGIYLVLGQNKEIEWEYVKLILTDERFVSIDDSESNIGMVEKTLLSSGRVPIDNLIFFPTEPETDIEVSLSVMRDEVEEVLKERTPLFDLLILGVGTDGHIASIFEESEAIESDDLVCQTETNEFGVKERLTFTLKGLSDAGEVWFVIRGARKNDVFNSLQSGKKIPAQLLAERVDKAKVWFGI